MPIVRVNIPYSGILNADVDVPECELDNVMGWISDNDDVVDDIVASGWRMEEYLDIPSGWLDE